MRAWLFSALIVLTAAAVLPSNASSQDWSALAGLEERRPPEEEPYRVEPLAQPTPLDAPRLLIIGDSWAQYMWDDGSHDDVLDRFGLADWEALSFSLGDDPGPGYTGPEVAVSGSEARQWTDTANYPWLANSVALLEQNPTIDWVMLSIGGNDFLAGRSDGGWYKDMDLDTPGSEAALIAQIEANTLVIVDALLAVRPDLKIVLSSYDYPNFNVGFWCFVYACPKRDDLSRDPDNDLVTDEELNGMMVLLESQRRDWCASRERVLFDNSIGLMHHLYGDGVAGPRVLPKPGSTDPLYEPFPGGNPLLPSLREVFRRPGGIDADPIHLDFEGYQIKIGHQVEAHLLGAVRGEPLITLDSRGQGEDGWSDGVSVGTTAIRAGDAGGRSIAGMISVDTSALPPGAQLTRARLWLTRQTGLGSSGVNPFTGSFLGDVAIDVVGGHFGASPAVEAGDATEVLDGLAPDQAVDAGIVVGSVRDDGYTLRIDLDADAREAIAREGLTQFRLRFAGTDVGDDYVSFATGDAGAWDLQTVSTFAEVMGSARPVLELDYDDATAVEDGAALARATLRLMTPTPNPFNPSTRIEFELDRDEGWVEISVYDLAGRRVRTLHTGAVTAGSHEVEWTGRDERGRSVASGVYLVRLATAEESVTKRAVLAK